MRHLLALFLLAIPLQAQNPVVSPQVGSDGSVTFRILAPNAKDVLVVLEGTQRVLLQKDAQGVWSGASGPLEPDLYGYVFVVDGLSVIDPSNPRMKPNLLNTQSVVHVPGPASLPWEIGDAARGTLHRHFYKSGIVGDDRDFYVYTPAGYHAGSRSVYPVLYLLHGFSDDASAWTSVGQAHVILDNLIAAGKVRPMLVVMPLGYGAPEILKRTGPRDPALSRKNMELFRDALLQEVLPQVERQYRVSKDRKDRAIAGLSMGGAESLFAGLNTLSHFAWIGAFSSGGLGDDLNATFPTLDVRANTQLRLLWIACGKDDRLIEGNKKLLEWFGSKGVHYTWVESPGAHTWRVWRRYLAEFTPLLFQ